jgi:hypothetical protein
MEPDGYNDYLRNKYGFFSRYYDEDLDEVEIICPIHSFLAKCTSQEPELSLISEIEDVFKRAEKKYGPL